MSEVNEHINLVLNYDNPDWDPSSPIYAQQESAMKNWKGEIITRKKTNWEVLSVKVTLPPRPKTNTPTATLECMNEWPKKTTPTTKPHVRIDAFTSSLLEQVNFRYISSTIQNGVSPEALAEKWYIGLTTAKRNTKVTTQRGVRTVDHPSLQWRFHTNYRKLRYRRLNTTMFTDTYLSSINSTRSNTCAQIWTNDIEWIRIEPIPTKSNAHHSAKKLFNNNGVP